MYKEKVILQEKNLHVLYLQAFLEEQVAFALSCQQ